MMYLQELLFKNMRIRWQEMHEVAGTNNALVQQLLTIYFFTMID